jgi:hypothetical protein
MNAGRFRPGARHLEAITPELAQEAPRVLYVGSTRLEVAPGVAVEALIPKQRVAVTGHRQKHDEGPWVVTKIEAHRPGF